MTPKQLKDWIKNKSNELNVSPQVIRRNYFLEKFLEKLSESEYKDNFVLKGEFLLGSTFGLSTRNTMDLDTTIKNIDLNKDKIESVIDTIIK